MYIAIGKGIVAALFYVFTSCVLGGLFQFCSSEADTDPTYFWFAGMFVFAIYVGSGFTF